MKRKRDDTGHVTMDIINKNVAHKISPSDSTSTYNEIGVI